MPATEDALHEYTDEAQPFLRWLGAAVIAQWDSLSAETQSGILEQAWRAYDGPGTVHLKKQIEIFINAHRPGREPRLDEQADA